MAIKNADENEQTEANEVDVVWKRINSIYRCLARIRSVRLMTKVPKKQMPDIKSSNRADSNFVLNIGNIFHTLAT